MEVKWKRGNSLKKEIFKILILYLVISIMIFHNKKGHLGWWSQLNIEVQKSITLRKCTVNVTTVIKHKINIILNTKMICITLVMNLLSYKITVTITKEGLLSKTNCCQILFNKAIHSNNNWELLTTIIHRIVFFIMMIR